MRDSFCLHGEPTGDETPLYLDDDGVRSRCPVCGYVCLDGRCAECNGRRIEALVAASGPMPAPAALTLLPAPMRRAA